MEGQREIKNRQRREPTPFEPKIISFCCNWCGYSAIELESSNRKHHSSNIGMIKVMCSGRIEPEFILKALKNGADGILILSCAPGDCQYESGNYKNRRKIFLLKKLLSQFGIDPKRIKLEYCSAEKRQDFAQVVEDFIENIKKIGPNPFDEDGRR